MKAFTEAKLHNIDVCAPYGWIRYVDNKLVVLLLGDRVAW